MTEDQLNNLREMKTFLRILWKSPTVLLLVALVLVLATEFSLIYDFRKPEPFTGPDIFNPYSALDTAQCWKKSVFHTHTRVKGPWPPNECPMWPQEVWDTYQKLGYDIVTFSNHNEITRHPFDSTLQVDVYEQGYGAFKYHKLVFGGKKPLMVDHIFPVLASQKQCQMEYLDRHSDFIQLNHPYRTGMMTPSVMAKLSGYEITELDTHISTQNEYWDQALSAGHYSFGLANDDLHHPEYHWRTGIRCNFLCTPSGRYEDIKNTLLGGCYYAMRVPDYGNGDWEEKAMRHHNLVKVEDIGLDGDRIYIRLSASADSIRINGQDHCILALEQNTDTLSYRMGPDDHFARFTAFFPDGAVIYSNPFARYDASVAGTPFDKAPQQVDWLLTVLFNLAILLLLAGGVWLIVKVIKR